MPCNDLSVPPATVILSRYTVALQSVALVFLGFGGVSQENRAAPPPLCRKCRRALHRYTKRPLQDSAIFLQPLDAGILILLRKSQGFSVQISPTPRWKSKRSSAGKCLLPYFVVVPESLKVGGFLNVP